MEQNLIEVELPFVGYYCSILDSHLDSKEEYERQYFGEYLKEKTVDRMMEGIDWRATKANLTKAYVRYYFESFQHNLYEKDIELEVNFEEKYWKTPHEMTSPKYYNFSTDQVFVNIELVDLQQLLYAVLKDAKLKASFLERIKQKFTSYDGFMSSYPNDLEEWGENDTWDHNQWGTLFEIICNAEQGAIATIENAEVELEYTEEGLKFVNRFMKRICQIQKLKWDKKEAVYAD